MTIMRDPHVLPAIDISIRLDLRRKRIEILFSHLFSTDGHQQQFRILFPFKYLKKVYFTSDDQGATLIMPLSTPPEWYRKVEPNHALDPNALQLREQDFWFRNTIMVHPSRRELIKQCPLQLNTKDMLIDFGKNMIACQSQRSLLTPDLGRWTTYRLKFGEATGAADFSSFLGVLSDQSIDIFSASKIEISLTNPKNCKFWKLIDAPQQDGDHPLLSLQQLNDDSVQLDFSVRYQLEVCISNGLLNEHTLDGQFLHKLVLLAPKKARLLLEAVAESQCCFWDPMQIFKLPIRRDPFRIPRHCVMMRSVTITPTTLHLHTPSVEISNRIVRQYHDQEDRFLRVRFTDEKSDGMNRLRSITGPSNDDLYSRVKLVMRNGLVIAGRQYHFLAFGSSQFREHGAYFFSSTPEEVENMRNVMGDFGNIKVLAKRCARVGQCFSTTRALRCKQLQIININDVVRNGYTFSDGVGKISKFLLQLVAQELGVLDPMANPPSLIQFRLGGCKGVLAMASDVKPFEIHIRPSQQKFIAPQEALEIIRCASFTSASLNRQLILVLSALGIQDSIFLRKLKIEIDEIDSAIDNESFALTALRKAVDYNQMTLVVTEMVANGFLKHRDPFVRSILKLWRAWRFKTLKEKARINIEKGASLLGCLDELGVLKGFFEDPQTSGSKDHTNISGLPEIFVQVDTQKSGKYQVIEGVCILARNPSLHPGDIRVVRAIDIPQLRHLKDVVVLPQTGDRDLANMCSGGDLDGDEFVVCWDEELIPKTTDYPAMDYSAPIPDERDEITVDLMTSWFVNYIKYDQLGPIARQHLVHADLSKQGVKDAKCLELAQLHSLAVDYPKSGNVVQLPKSLRIRKRPHYIADSSMDKNLVYHSKSILGQLYDEVDLVEFVAEYDTTFDDRILTAYELDEDTLTQAAEIKENYDSDMRRLMAQYGIQTEFEVWTVFVLKHNLTMKDYTFTESFGRIVNSLKDQYKEVCFRKVGGSKFEQMAPFVAAMYTTTARELSEALREQDSIAEELGSAPVISMPLISFPWIFAKELGIIATGRTPIANRSNLIIDDGELQSRCANIELHTDTARLKGTKSEIKYSEETTIGASNGRRHLQSHEDDASLGGEKGDSGQLTRSVMDSVELSDCFSKLSLESPGIKGDQGAITESSHLDELVGLEIDDGEFVEPISDVDTIMPCDTVNPHQVNNDECSSRRYSSSNHSTPLEDYEENTAEAQEGYLEFRSGSSPIFAQSMTPVGGKGSSNDLGVQDVISHGEGELPIQGKGFKSAIGRLEMLGL